MTEQPNLFESLEKTAEPEKLTLFALGEFQSRGKILAERELPLDRLRGAFKRAAEVFNAAELPDGAIAEILQKLGAKVKEVPSFVAKHPYRITVKTDLAEKSKAFYKDFSTKD